MRKDAMTRIRLRIRARLDELGMTARELARAVRNDAIDDKERDGWISGILSGRQGLHVKYFDAVADKLGLSPSDLVRYDDSELRELTPREMRLLRHYQEWPNDMQDRWLAMLDFFTSEIPDKDTAALLDKIRQFPRGYRATFLGWLFQLLEEGVPPEALTYGVRSEAGAAPAAPARLRRGLRRKPLSGTLTPKPDGE